MNPGNVLMGATPGEYYHDSHSTLKKIIISIKTKFLFTMIYTVCVLMEQSEKLN